MFFIRNKSRQYGFFVLLATSFLVAFLCAPEAAYSQYFGRNKVQYEDYDFRILESKYFDLYFYGAEADAAPDLARAADRWYYRHSRVFERTFDERKPLIFYANDVDFRQTNILQGPVGAGVGGVTESLKERVVIPLTPLPAETSHVLGHELVHSFQYDIALNDTLRIDLRNYPLWFIEGMAEYLSVGNVDPLTAMWLRDAVAHDDVPTLEEMTRSPQEYFPYRFGQAYMAFIGARYGDRAIPALYKMVGRVGVDSAFTAVLGDGTEEISEAWTSAVKSYYSELISDRTPPDAVGRQVLNEDRTGGEIHVSPAVSPDGRYVAFLSERDIFFINLFVADTQTGEIVASLDQVGLDPHFDAIRFINSAGAWSPDSKKLAFVTFADGDNELAVLDVEQDDVVAHYDIDEVPAILNPAWSPDGGSIVFTGLADGFSDLYRFELDSEVVTRLTHDEYADMQPAWSADGRSIAFISDRGDQGSSLQNLDYAPPGLAIYDVASGQIRSLRPFGQATHLSPQFSPDGASLYFVATADGFKDVYRIELSSGKLFQVTALQSGVTGIGAYSPALSVATQTGDLFFSVFDDKRYNVVSVPAAEARGHSLRAGAAYQPVAAVLPPPTRERSFVESMLDAPNEGLTMQPSYDTRSYSPSLSLDYVAPPTLGVSVGGAFGTGLVGGVGMFFSDMLGNHNLGVAVSAQGRLKDIGGQVSYMNRGNRFNYGAAAHHVPIRYATAFVDVAEDPETGVVTQRVRRQVRRIYSDQASLQGAYPFSTTRRFELGAGAVRYGFDYELETFYVYGNQVRRDRRDLEAPDPLYLAQAVAAFVGDYSYAAFTSPVMGGRYRFEVAPYVGSASFLRVTADYRRYFFARPFTLAVRGLHIGNYGADVEDPFSTEYLGYPYYRGFVRGYQFSSLDASECVDDGNGACIETSRLFGTRIALAGAELRIPLFGSEEFGLIPFRFVPMELSAFADAGLAWTGDEAPEFDFSTDSSGRSPVVSAGGALRMNVLGQLVFEIFAAHPFQRPNKDLVWGFRFAPGW